MAYKLAISNIILTKVKGTYTDEAGSTKTFDFQLEQDRIDQDGLKRTLTDKTEDAVEFLKRITKGWRGQRLVLNDDGTPADFCPEAFDCLLNVSGMGGYCFQAYLDQVLVKQKN